MTEPTLNDLPLRSTFHALILEGALGALLAPPPAKPLITSSSRLQHGERVLSETSSGASLSRVAARDVTLTFAIQADSYEQADERLTALVDALRAGDVRLVLPQLPQRVFHLRYLSCQTFTHVRGRLLKAAIRFREPNPMDRS